MTGTRDRRGGILNRWTRVFSERKPWKSRGYAASKTTLFTLAYQYEIYNRDQTVVDLLAGARYWGIDSEFRFGG